MKKMEPFFKKTTTEMEQWNGDGSIFWNGTNYWQLNKSAQVNKTLMSMKKKKSEKIIKVRWKHMTALQEAIY